MPASARTPSAPATPGQVQAHRFSLRRLQSALVRRESVPGGHGGDPLRTQSRAQVAGILLAVLVLGGFAVWGLVKRPADWRAAALVVGADSGAVYVVVGRERLLPVPNIASARLLLAGTRAGGAAPEPVEIPEARLAGVPRLPPVGIPDAPALPPADAAVPAVWSVCDSGSPDPAPPPGTSVWARPRVWSTVVAGDADPGSPLGAGQGLLLRDRFEGTWLVHDGVRSRLDITDRAVVLAFGLAGQLPRPVTTGLLNSLPEAPPIVSPAIPGRGTPLRRDLGGEAVGGVVRVANPGQPVTWYVVAADGVQAVPELVANLVRLGDPVRAGVEPPFVSPNQLPGRSRVVPDGVYPARAPALVPMADAVTACTSSRGGDPRPRLSLAAGGVPSGPSVTLAGADGSGDGLDAVAVPGSGVTVRTVPAGRPDAPGALAVVSGSGRVSGIGDPGIAAALGLGTAFAPAPQSVVGLLPAGPALTTAAAQQPLTG